MTKHKKIKCPYCGSEDIAEYLYGLYGYDVEMEKDIEAGKIILAGCCIEIPNYNPDYRCRDCGKDFGGNLAKMLVSDDEVLKFAKENGFEGIKYLGAWQGYHVYDAIIETYPNPFRVHIVGYPCYILVKEDKIELFYDDKLEIIDYFYADDEEDEDDDVQMTETGKRLLELLIDIKKKIKTNGNFLQEIIGQFNSDEQMQAMIDVIEIYNIKENEDRGIKASILVDFARLIAKKYQKD